MQTVGHRPLPLQKARKGNDEPPPPPLWRKLAAEALGTAALTFVAAGAVVIDATSQHAVGHIAKVVVPGLLIMAMIYTVGEVSGAHFNPAVTLAFALRGAIHWAEAGWYWAAQFAGAIGAASILRLLFGPMGALGATLPGRQYTTAQAFITEVILTGLLVLVILGTAQQARLVGPNAALAVGATIALDGLFASPVSDASMNPARSLGPALFGVGIHSVWIYLLAPLLGAAAAVGLSWLIHGAPNQSERRAGEGEQRHQTAA
jgi:aquaporin Z